MKKVIRLAESDIHNIVKRAVKRVLKEGYNDDDTYMSNYRDAMSDYYDEDPRDDYPEGKQGDIDYSWDYEPDVYTPTAKKYHHDKLENMANFRDTQKYWTDRDNERGRKLMTKWVNGECSTDDLEDADFSVENSWRRK